jgi:hypothetical protein
MRHAEGMTRLVYEDVKELLMTRVAGPGGVA